MIGPTPKEEYWIKESGGVEPAHDSIELKYHHTAAWIHPAHRGKGLSVRMVESAIGYAEVMACKGGNSYSVRIRASTTARNTASLKLYEKCGFKRQGLCTYPEAMKANGNEEYYPALGLTEDEGKQRNVLVLEYTSGMAP
jgi:RimJ/RimL family protein N-acetyltransferase